MSYHVDYSHVCPTCGAYYIPYDENIPCPRCGVVETERFDFIREATASASVNMQEFASFVRPAWWVGSFADHILQILFFVLEHHRQQTPVRNFSEVAQEALTHMEWGDQVYLRDHIHAIACRVREQLDADAKN
jgi:hypothetical protein